MTERERIISFDKKIKEYEKKRGYGVGSTNPGVVVLEVISTMLMLVVPMDAIYEYDYFLIMLHVVSAGAAGILNMSWLLAALVEGQAVSWKQYLKYVPVDWKEFRRYRYEILLKYTGKMFLCYGGAQLAATLWWVITLHQKFTLWGVVYAAGICIVCILLPGIFRVRRWT